MLQEQWKVADFLYECGQLWSGLAKPPCILGGPCTRGSVQEADTPELSADEFESLLGTDIYCSTHKLFCVGRVGG
jgi:hypothetical protein